MAGSGMELSLGILRDEDFGPIVMVGAGGVTIEILNERRFAMPPFDAERAKKLVTKLGFMSDISRAPARVPDIDSVARSLARLSLLACDLRDDISALDINPMIVTPSGCVTVDALLIPRSV
jgi:succinyl-CoA synthetase beta subunit